MASTGAVEGGAQGAQYRASGRLAFLDGKLARGPGLHLSHDGAAGSISRRSSSGHCWSAFSGKSALVPDAMALGHAGRCHGPADLHRAVAARGLRACPVGRARRRCASRHRHGPHLSWFWRVPALVLRGGDRHLAADADRVVPRIFFALLAVAFLIAGESTTFADGKVAR